MKHMTDVRNPRSKNSTTRSQLPSTLTRAPRSRVSDGCLLAARPLQSVSVRLCSSLRYAIQVTCNTSCRRRRGGIHRLIAPVRWRIWRIIRPQRVDRLWILRARLSRMRSVVSFWLPRACHWVEHQHITRHLDANEHEADEPAYIPSLSEPA